MSDAVSPDERPTNWTSLLIMGGCALALAFVFIALVGPTNPGIGLPRPPLSPAGWIGDVSLSEEQLNGKVLVIDAWASWCGPCIGETKHLVDVYNRFGENPRIQFLGITMQTAEELPMMKTFIDRLHVPWPNAYGAETFFQTLNISTIPRVFVVNPSGQIIWTNMTGGEIEEAIGRALKM